MWILSSTEYSDHIKCETWSCKLDWNLSEPIFLFVDVHVVNLNEPH